MEALAIVAALPPIEQLQQNQLTVEQLMKELEEVKAKLAAVTPSRPAPMTVEEAKALMASFAGKKGRRPAIFMEAKGIVEASLTKEDRAAAKASAKAAKVEAKKAARAAKIAKKEARQLATLTAKAALAKAASDKVAKVFLRLSSKYEALEAQVQALTPPVTPPES